MVVEVQENEQLDIQGKKKQEKLSLEERTCFFFSPQKVNFLKYIFYLFVLK
jgi:hypothetical protein